MPNPTRGRSTQDMRETLHTPEREEKFLEALRTGASIATSARVAGVGRRTVFGWKEKNAEFAAAWEDAYEHGTDLMEDEAKRRAVEGVTEPVFYKGEIVGHVQKYSDGLLEVKLKARRREKYSTRTDMNHSGNVTVTPTKFAEVKDPKGA